jgi:drug/metabolite transporter (DMT)-like permease
MVLMTAIEPVLNPIWVFLALGEKPGFWSLAGGGVVLVVVTGWGVLKSLKSRRA